MLCTLAERMNAAALPARPSAMTVLAPTRSESAPHRGAKRTIANIYVPPIAPACHAAEPASDAPKTCRSTEGSTGARAPYPKAAEKAEKQRARKTRFVIEILVLSRAKLSRRLSLASSLLVEHRTRL